MFILCCTDTENEHFTDGSALSNEAIQNIANVYNSTNLIATNITATGTTGMGNMQIKKDGAANSTIGFGEGNGAKIKYITNKGTPVLDIQDNGDVTAYGKLTSTGQISTAGKISAAASISSASNFVSTGTSGGYFYNDRKDPGATWAWYSDNGASHLWRSGKGDMLSVSTTGTMSPIGQQVIIIDKYPGNEVIAWDRKEFLKAVRDGRYFTSDMPDGTMKQFYFVHSGDRNPNHPNKWIYYAHVVKYGKQLFLHHIHDHEGVPNPMTNNTNDASWRINYL